MLRSWDFKMNLDRAVLGLSLHLQIAQKIIDEICCGRLAPSSAMPGTRVLSDSLNVNRKTVVLTYSELIAQGWLIATNRRGTFVTTAHPISSHLKSNKKIESVNSIIVANKCSEKQLIESIEVGGGTPDARLAPYEAISRSYRHSLVKCTRNNFICHSEPRGSAELRKSLVQMLTMEKGFQISDQNICVVNGNQMALYIVARYLTKSNDYIIVETPTYNSVRDTFLSCGANVLSVGVDSEGLRIDELELLCRTHNIRAVYVTPQHQFPTTVILSNARRKKLLRLADQYDFIIVEDDRAYENSYSHIANFPLAAEAKSDKVIYIGSLSSIFYPSFNIGYLVASEQAIANFVTEILLIDPKQDIARELSLAELLSCGEAKRHICRVNKIYLERRDMLASLIEQELYDWVQFSVPQGGLALWLKFHEEIDVKHLKDSSQSLNLNLGLELYVTKLQTTLDGIRIGFGNANQLEIKELIKKLNSLMQSVSGLRMTA